MYSQLPLYSVKGLFTITDTDTCVRLAGDSDTVKANSHPKKNETESETLLSCLKFFLWSFSLVLWTFSLSLGVSGPLRFIYSEQKWISFFDLCLFAMWTFKLDSLWTHLEVMLLSLMIWFRYKWTLRRNAKELLLDALAFAFYWRSVRDCTSDLVADCDVSEEHAQVSLLKGDCGNAWMTGCLDVA